MNTTQIKEEQIKEDKIYLDELDELHNQILEDTQTLQWERIDKEHIVLEFGCQKAIIHTEKEALKWLRNTIKEYINYHKIFEEEK